MQKNKGALEIQCIYKALFIFGSTNLKSLVFDSICLVFDINLKTVAIYF
ncbi:hypothetical protein SAMN05444671_4312 [Flavobacterium sp. CF108]|nr:hypothetical protein [Flavobacterium sp. CF108]SHH92537.1 hypothetical protein SAMN05444671_4312 [Flavobacterium sp. CF108]